VEISVLLFGFLWRVPSGRAINNVGPRVDTLPFSLGPRTKMVRSLLKALIHCL